MGKRDDHLSIWINYLIAHACIDATAERVWEEVDVLWIDGSLFYRAIDWSHNAKIAVWADYLRLVCESLVAVIRRCPNLRAVVYSIDKYGYPARTPLPKEMLQAERYRDCQPVPCPAMVYQADQPVLGVSSTNTFGNSNARLAFNCMVSAALVDTLTKLVYDDTLPLELAILDGCVVRRTIAEGPHPDDVRVGDTDAPNDVWRPGVRVIGQSALAPTDDLWCSHSEGDIAAAHWLAKFAHLNTIVYSADVDLQQVTLQHVRRLADAGKRPAELPRIHLFKRFSVRGGPQEYMYDMKVYFQQVCSLIQPLLHADDPSNPIDVWSALTALSGNDVCAPWLCCEKCRLGEKANNGVRLEAIWTAFVLRARHLAPLFMPTTEADRRADAWSSLQLPAYAYPMEMRVEAWRALMDEACSLQQQRLRTLKVAGNAVLMLNKGYVNAQLRRVAWALSYYANAALLGDDMPRGTEQDASGLSIHGWAVRDTATEMTNRVPATAETVCGVSARDAPTRPPTPTERPLEELLAEHA